MSLKDVIYQIVFCSILSTKFFNPKAFKFLFMRNRFQVLSVNFSLNLILHFGSQKLEAVNFNKLFSYHSFRFIHSHFWNILHFRGLFVFLLAASDRIQVWVDILFLFFFYSSEHSFSICPSDPYDVIAYVKILNSLLLFRMWHKV